MFKMILCLLFFFPLLSKADFEIQKYLGMWNELYSIPQHFKKGCFNVTAEYSLNLDHSIKVINTCRDQKGNLIKNIEGLAIVKNINQRYLKVYFLDHLD